MELLNRKAILKQRPQGVLKVSDFEVVEETVGELNENEVIVNVEHLSVDAFIATTLNHDGLHGLADLRAPVTALGTGRIVASRFTGLNQGDAVFGPMGAQKFTRMMGAVYRKIENDAVPTRAYLGILGMTTGLTAYVGMILIGEVQQGDTVVVSAAAGAVGTVACQIARIKGARVIGIAGGPGKMAYLRQIGCDDGIDYKNEDVPSRLSELIPGGVNVYFDNVGGDLLDNLLDVMADESRIVICGAISQYHHMEKVQGPSLYLRIAERNASMRGFTVNYYVDRYSEMEADLSSWMAAGEITLPEHIEEGIDRFPEALVMLFNGGHKGKLLVTP